MKIEMCIRMVLLIAFGAASVPAIAEDHDWVTFASGKKAEFQYDTLSVQRSRSGLARAWVKVTGDKDQRIELESKFTEGLLSGFKARAKYSNYSHTLSLWEVDCNRRTGGSGTRVEYDHKGNAIESSDGIPNHRPIVPDSIMEEFFQRLC